MAVSYTHLTVKFRFSLRKRNDTEMKIKEKIKRKLLENNAASRRRLDVYKRQDQSSGCV